MLPIYRKYVLAICLLPVILSGCAAKTMISKRNLAVETKMTNTVFLDPVETEQKTVYLQVKNTSDKSNLNVANIIKNNIESKGYKISNSPKKSHYMIQVNVLQVGASDLREVEKAMSDGYGSAIGGAIIGTGVAIVVDKNHKDETMVAGQLIGAAANVVIDALVKDVVYTMITDIQISERSLNGVTFNQETNSKLKQGNSTTVNVVSNEVTCWKKYQTRVVSSANKVNLKFEETAPILAAELASSISNIL